MIWLRTKAWLHCYLSLVSKCILSTSCGSAAVRQVATKEKDAALGELAIVQGRLNEMQVLTCGSCKSERI